MFVDGQTAAELSFDNIGRTDTPYSSLLVVPQRDTEAILNDELQRLGVTVERQVEVTGFEQAAGGVTVRAKGADGAAFEASAAFLVGADGAHSVVRKTLGLKFEGAAYPQGFLLADCRTDLPLEPDRMTFFLHGKHFAVCFPLPGGEKRVRIVVSEPVETDAHAPVGIPGGHGRAAGGSAGGAGRGGGPGRGAQRLDLVLALQGPPPGRGPLPVGTRVRRGGRRPHP